MVALTFINPGSNTHHVSPLISTTNFYEHEIIFFSPHGLSSEMKKGANRMVHSDQHQAVSARMAELTEWVEKGHALVVLEPASLPYTYTLQNQAIQNNIESFSPLNSIKLTPKSGNNVQVVPRKEISELLAAHIPNASYRVVMTGKGLVPLVTVKTTKNTSGPADIVAGYIELGQGLVVFAPHWAAANSPYWAALIQLLSVLRRAKADLPAWTDEYRTPREAEIFDTMRSRELEVEQLTAEITGLKDAIEIDRPLKQLFAGSGSDFEEAVSRALSELGLEVVPGPHPRADLLATDGARVAAVEAKGVEGGAKEEYVRQVMTWMPEVDLALSTPLDADAEDPVIDKYKEKLRQLDLSKRDGDTDCKGILVLGTFRTLPLTQRSQPDFVDNVVQVLMRQDVCALTGLQLYCLVVMARSEPALKPKITAALFDTRGLLEMAKDWRATFIQQPTKVEDRGA